MGRLSGMKTMQEIYADRPVFQSSSAWSCRKLSGTLLTRELW